MSEARTTGGVANARVLLALAFKLAWRSVLRNRRRSLITTCAIAFGLALGVFFISFADGVYAQMVDDAVRMQAGHLTIEHRGYRAAPAVDLFVNDVRGLRAKVEALPGVERSKAIILGQGVAKSGSGAIGVALVGVEPAAEVDSSPLAKKIVAGRYLEPEDEGKVVIGAKLAERLRLEPGKKLVVTTNNAAGELTEELLRVAGVFRLGADEIDAYFIQVPIGFARKLYGLPAGAATQLGVIVGVDGDAEGVLLRARGLVADLRPEAVALRWQEVLPELAAYIRLDRGSNYIFQGVLVFISLFTIFNTVLMSVLERTRDFARQLALGTPRGLLRMQILVESGLLGLFGCVLGLVLGGAAGLYLQVNGFDLRLLYDEGMSVSGFALDTMMYARVDPMLLAKLGGGVWLATLATSLLPMRQLGRIRTADVLR